MTESKLWPRRPPKCGVFSLIFGLLSLLMGLMCAFFRTPVHEVVDFLIRQQTSLTRQSLMTDLWMQPPLKPRLHIFIYNVTNADMFLSGNQTISVQELGPYVYEAPQVKRVLEWSEDMTAIKFQSRTVYTFLQEESGPGLNDLTDMVTVPNLLMMTGMLKTEVRPQPDFIKKSVIWTILTSAGLKTPFVRLSVNQFLWGYEDELACLDSSPQKNAENDLFDNFDDGDDFFSLSSSENEQEPANSGFANKKKNFRQPDGRCMFGALVEKNASWESEVTMMSGKSGLADKGRILDIDGSQIFGVWQKNSKCDRLSGSIEPSALPPAEILEDFDMLMGIMCRSIKMEHMTQVDYGSYVKAKRFVMAKDTFELNSPDNQCYDPDPDLPGGIMSVAKCCEGSPLAVSSPHFLHGDKWYREQVRGVSEPNSAKHELYIDLEPHLGALVGVQARFQLNIVIRPDPAFPPLKNLKNAVTVLPIFWAQEGYDELPENCMQRLNLALLLPDLFADGLIIVCVVVGVVLVSIPVFKSAKSFLVEHKLHSNHVHHKCPISKSTTATSVVSSSSKPLYNPLPYTDVEEESSLDHPHL